MFRFLGEAMLNQDCWLLHHSRSYGFYAQQHEPPSYMGTFLKCTSVAAAAAELLTCKSKISPTNSISTLSPPLVHLFVTAAPSSCWLFVSVMLSFSVSAAYHSLFCSPSVVSVSADRIDRNKMERVSISQQGDALKQSNCYFWPFVPILGRGSLVPMAFFSFPLKVVRLFDLKKRPTKKAISSQVCPIKSVTVKFSRYFVGSCSCISRGWFQIKTLLLFFALIMAHS